MIKYAISMVQNTHIYKILLQWQPQTKQSILKLPTWIPGSYMLREFSKNIINIAARQNNNVLKCEQTSKNSWQLSGYKIGYNVEVEYEVYALDFGIRTAYLDNKRGYFNATSLCLYIVDYEHLIHSIEFANLPRTWNIATGLDIQDNQYRAASYAELIDHPFELGEFIRLSFKVKNVTHYIVLSGTVVLNFDSQRLIADVIKICQTQIDLFASVVPFNTYTFLLYLGGEIYTGLEHRNSTALMAPYYSLPVLHMSEINDDYLKLLGLISHEYFHLWNVKRIKPQVFSPYDLQAENYTSLLWWFEGITSYYDDLVLYRAGLIDKKRYLHMVLDNINNVYKFSGVARQSLANSSLTSWVKYYRPDENSPNSLVSYYVKGALVGLCLDLMIRRHNPQKSLDHVLCGLYEKWVRDGRGLNEDEITQLIKKFTDVDLTEEIRIFTTTTEMLPLKGLFEIYGVTLEYVAGDYTDSGTLLDKVDVLPKNNKLSLGIKAVKESIGYRIINVYANSPAAEAGLAANDILLAIDSIKLTDLNKQLGLYTARAKLTITLFRQEQLLNISLIPKADLTTIYYFKISDAKKLAKWLE